jgi:RNA polymerase sigma factor (sigma-70 family)
MNIEKYMPLAESIARKLSGGDHQKYDDYLGAAYEGLVRASNTIDRGLSKGEAVEYLKTSIRGSVLNYIRDTEDIGAEPLEASGPLQSTNTLKDIENRSTIDHLMSLLSNRQQEIFLLYEGLGYNQTQIGGALGISQQAVAQVLDSCHVIFRQQGYKKEGQPERNFNLHLVK